MSLTATAEKTMTEGDKLVPLPRLPVETCSLPYREGEYPKARAKRSIAWYSDDKQCLLYPNVNQMIT
jgi:Leu/Phe-tRNA-protein transferase